MGRRSKRAAARIVTAILVLGLLPLSASAQQPIGSPPQGTLQATLAPPNTNLVADIVDPDPGALGLQYEWSADISCGVFTEGPLPNQASWSHPNGTGPGQCPHTSADHPGSVTVTVTDGFWRVTCTHLGSLDGTTQCEPVFFQPTFRSFPFLYGNAGYSSRLKVQNTGGTPADVTVAYFPTSGTPSGQADTIPAGSHRSFAPNAGFDGSAGVYSDAPVVAGEVLYFDGSASPASKTGGAYLGAAPTGSDLIFPVLHNAGGSTTFFTVQNSGSTQAQVSIDYFMANGVPAGSTSVTVPPRSDMWVDPPIFFGAALLDSNVPVSGTAITYDGDLGAGDLEGVSAYNAFSLDLGSKVTYLPFGSTRSGLSTDIYVQNLGTSPASISMQYRTDSGTFTDSATAPVNGYAIFSPSTKFQEEDFSARISSQEPLAAVARILFDSTEAGLDVSGSSRATSVPAMRDWAVPYIPYMSDTHYSLEIFNPGTSSASVKVNLSGLDASGTDVPITPYGVTVPAGDRRSIDVTAILAPYGSYRGAGVAAEPVEASAVVSSTVPVVVGQQSYWDNTVDGMAINGGDHASAQVIETTGPTEIATDLTIRYASRAGAFKGRAIADAPCHKGRRVVVKKVRKGKDATVGRTRTNKRGRWKLPLDDARGRYYARAKGKSPNASLFCLPDASRRIRVRN